MVSGEGGSVIVTLLRTVQLFESRTDAVYMPAHKFWIVELVAVVLLGATITPKAFFHSMV
jgi:hypothetical protein